MSDAHILGRWWLRDESVDDAARRIEQTASALGELSAHWRPFQFSGSKLAGVTARRAREVLLKDRLTDDHGRVMKGQGHSLMLLAGPGRIPLERSNMHVRCCKSSWSAGFNVLSVELPRSGPSLKQLLRLEVLAGAIAALATIWDPDWLGVWDLRTHAVRRPWANAPVLGWINYLHPRAAAVPTSLPAGWSWREFKGVRLLIHDAGPPRHIPGREPDPMVDPEVMPEDVADFSAMNDRIRWAPDPMVAARLADPTYRGPR